MGRWVYLLTGLAGLAGAAGVIEAAMAAHGHAEPRLSTSAHFLTLNAAAAIALNGFALAGVRAQNWLLAASTLLLGGGFLFCADLSHRAFTGERLFPFAAPTGGTLMIIGWLLAAATALCCAFIPRRGN